MKEIKSKKTLYNTDTFGDNLKNLRKSKGYTQKQLTEEISNYGITLDIRQYRDYEKKKSKFDISSQRLYVISDILGVSMNDLVGKTFNSKNMNNVIFNTTGLTEKSIKKLKRSRQLSKVRSERIKNNAKHHTSKKLCPSNYIIDLDEVDVINYLIENSDVFTSFVNNARLAYIDLLELQKVQNELKNKLNNATNEEEIKKLKKEISKAKDKKDTIINYHHFNVYNSINKSFKKYIQYLDKIDTQNYITKK